jgi:hypothetical protein
MIYAVAVVALAGLAFFLFSGEANALTLTPMLEVTGSFEALDDTVTPNVITLKVNGEEASGPLSDRCVFSDERGVAIDQKTFVARYIRRFITIELVESSGEVVSCRAGS